jgi:uncharacterized protein (TIGR03000 family)
MSRNWLSFLLGAALLGALPSVSSAQQPVWSPYHYLTHGSYWDPYYYSAPGTSPGPFAGTAMAVYGDSYSPYDYLRHGTYAALPVNATNPRFGFPLGRAFSGYTPSHTFVPRDTVEVPANDTHAFIHVLVPANAEIWFEGDKTNQTGPERNFVSPALPTGKSFTYDIRARWTDGTGKTVDKTKQVKVEAGRRSTVDFVGADENAKP